MKKKVLIAINDFSANSVGISLINLLNGLDFSKYSVDLIFCKSQTTLLNQIPKSVRVVNSPFTSKLSLFTKLKMFHRYNFSLMYDIGNKNLTDIVRLASFNNSVYIHRDYKLVYAVPSKYDSFILENKIFDFSKLIFSNDKICERFNSLFPSSSKNSFVLNYAVNDKYVISMSKRHAEVDKPDHKTLLIAVGSLNDRSKNYSLMIKMMSDLIRINSRVHLWILGDGPDLVNIKMLVRKLKLDDFVTLFGFKNNPYPYMIMADYVLNTSDSSDSTTTFLEAKVLEKPIITTSCDVHDENTYIVSPNPDVIASDVNKIISNNIKYKGANNFWVQNQKIYKDLEYIISLR